MKNKFLQRKIIYYEFTTNVEALTKDVNDYLDRKVYANYFADIAPMILATATNTVLNIIEVDKTARRASASNQNQTRTRSESTNSE